MPLRRGSSERYVWALNPLENRHATACAPPHDPPALEITCIGGPTAPLSIDGIVFITDPTLDAAGGD